MNSDDYGDELLCIKEFYVSQYESPTKPNLTVDVIHVSIFSILFSSTSVA